MFKTSHVRIPSWRFAIDSFDRSLKPPLHVFHKRIQYNVIMKTEFLCLFIVFEKKKIILNIIEKIDLVIPKKKK